MRSFLFAVLLVPLVAFSQSEADKSSLYESALTYFHEGSLRSAAIEVRNLLQMDSNHLGARILKGEIELVSGNGAAAQESFETARKLGAPDELYLTQLAEALIQQRKFDQLYTDIHPGIRDPALESSVYIAHGKAALEEGKTDEAELLFQSAEKLWPQAPEPRVAYAIIAHRRGDMTAAEKLIVQATQESPEFAQAWYFRGTLARERRELDLALGYFSRAIARNAYYVIARNSRVALLIQKGLDEQALEDIQFVLDFRPLDPQANYRYALLLARDGELEAADLAMRRVRNSLSTMGLDYVYAHPPSLFLHGVISFEAKDFIEARRAFIRYLQFVPGDIGARQLLGILYAREGNYAEVVSLIEPAVSASPNNPQLLALLGQAKMQLKDVDQATALFERAVELTPFDKSIRTQLALTRLATGRQTQAISDLEEVLQFSEGSANIAVMLGVIYLKRGDPEAAIEWANRALETSPESLEAENLIGAAQLNLGREDQAKSSFERAVELDPVNPTARYNLAAIAGANNDREEVRRQLESISGANAREVEAMARLARMSMADGDVESAIKWYEKIGVVDPSAIMNQIELLEIYLSLGRIQEANWLVSGLVSSFPDHLKVQYALGRTKLAENKPAEAAAAFARMSVLAGHKTEELHRISQLQLSANDVDGAYWSLEKALQSQPEYLPALVSLCNLEQRRGNTAESLEVASRIQQFYPKNEIGFRMAGEILLIQGKTADAMLAFAKGLETEPTAGLHRAILLLEIKNSENNIENQNAALAKYDSWIQANPEDFEARRTYAGVLYQIGRLDKSLVRYAQLLEEQPRDAQLHNAMAYIYLQLGDKRALSHAQQAYSLAPNDPLVLDTYGWLLFKQGDSEQALTFLRQARLKSPNISELRYHLGVVLHDLRRFKEAELELEEALERGQDFEGASEARALLDTIRSA